MAKLTDGQIVFLASHGISVDDMFDGSELTGANRKSAMARAGKRFYYGGTPCGAAGHTLRSKRGACIQCKPQEIAYATRHSSDGQLYIAGSLEGRFVKIGSAINAQDRLKHLRSEGYGGVDDWALLASTATLSSAGSVEALVHGKLRAFACQAVYQKGDVNQKATELFRCSFATAAQTMLETLASSATMALHCELDVAKMYDWRPIL